MNNNTIVQLRFCEYFLYFWRFILFFYNITIPYFQSVLQDGTTARSTTASTEEKNRNFNRRQQKTADASSSNDGRNSTSQKQDLRYKNHNMRKRKQQQRRRKCRGIMKSCIIYLQLENQRLKLEPPRRQLWISKSTKLQEMKAQTKGKKKQS